VSCASLASDRRTFTTLYRWRWDPGAPATPVELRLRPLGGASVWVRPNASDTIVIWDTFVRRFEDPPERISPGTILDLGANIGITTAYLATRYPEAQIVAVELDSANASLCRRNVASWADRCAVVEAAVWHEDGRLSYAPGAVGREYDAAVSPEGSEQADAISLNTLVGGDGIDYVKMDIEGAEENVLRTNTEWADRVRSIKVEVHNQYTLQDCLADLIRLGFRAHTGDRHAASVVGIR
jgi:FkbM family methyltransferase